VSCFPFALVLGLEKLWYGAKSDDFHQRPPKPSLNGDKSILKRIQAEIDNIAISVLVVAELDYGAKVSQRFEENLEKLYRLVDIVEVLPFDIECARIFGTIKSKLRNIGKPTGEVDALIAATAMAREATLVTSNKKQFENIEGLKIEVWPIGQ